MKQENDAIDSDKFIIAGIEYRRCLTQGHSGIRHHFDYYEDSLDEVFSSWIAPVQRVDSHHAVRYTSSAKKFKYC